MRKREIRESARQAVHAFITVNLEAFPETDLCEGIDYDEMDSDDLDTLYDEFDRILKRIWP